MKNTIKSIHPFPARMAPEIVWDELPKNSKNRLRILDPMAGSGTTLVMAKLRGHEAIGYDRDPLAVLIARSWLTNIDVKKTEEKASVLLSRAQVRARDLSISEAYPRSADEETKAFVRFWFDDINRIQLCALADSISRIHNTDLRNLMWCAFSRLIITKKVGTSLAMDVSHSRPHRTYDRAPIDAFDHFERAVKRVIQSSPFSSNQATDHPASMNFADARDLPDKNSSVDMIITSPPYLNAIDYIRGHKFSLIWMGHSIKELREVRSTNVGSEVTGKILAEDIATDSIMDSMCSGNSLSNKNAAMLRQYVRDLRSIISESKRVLRKGGKAVFVIGDCNIKDTFVQNSKGIEELAIELGMTVGNIRKRPLPENRRYLPPPGTSTAGNALKKRMREEVVLTLYKEK